MISLTQGLEITFPARLSFQGFGGKTSIIWQLAEETKAYAVLVTPTTKMYPREEPGIALIKDAKQFSLLRPFQGILQAGEFSKTSGKLESFSLALLTARAGDFDLILAEGDGSFGLPLKGWKSDEPVLFPECDYTVGVICLNSLGKEATDTSVFRLEEFLQLVQKKPGDIITLEDFVTVILAEEGLFRRKQGKLCVMINQVEDEATQKLAVQLLEEIKARKPDFFTHLLYGSARLREWKKFT